MDFPTTYHLQPTTCSASCSENQICAAAIESIWEPFLGFRQFGLALLVALRGIRSIAERKSP